MPRTLEMTQELHKLIYEHWVYAHKNQRQITNMVNDDPILRDKFGTLDPSTVNYHVNQIRMELESSLSPDAVERYTAEYVRFQHTIESEIEDVEGVISLIDKQNDAKTWLALKRLKKDLIETKLRALQDHELPLTVKKLKQERYKFVKPLPRPELPIEIEPTELSDK